MRWAVGLGVLVVVASCGAADDGRDIELVVSAAASLTDAFSEIEAAFELEHPDVDVVLNLGGSSSLREQILGGAGVDVFASADRANMDRVVSAGETASTPEVMAVNRLQIAVPQGNPGGVEGIGDFDRSDLFLGACAAAVPCGTHARAVLERAGVDPAFDTEEPDVRALLTKLESGELDAGIVYETDVLGSNAVDAVAIPPELQVPVVYEIAPLARSAFPTLAESFVDYVLADEGQEILRVWGFSR